MNQNEIGSFIAAKRREKNLTQEALAEKLGVSNKTVSKWENGKCMPDYAIVEALCSALDITVAELLGGRVAEPRNEEQYEMLLYKVQELEHKVQAEEQRNAAKSSSVNVGVTFGSALAMVISYVTWKSVGWAILHGVFGWGYVIYYLIKY